MTKIPHPGNYECQLVPDGYYHIYNRTNNKEALYRSDENRQYFLMKFQEYLLPFLAVYSYCLLDTHFHFLIKVQNAAKLEKHLLQLPMGKRSILQKRELDQSPDLRTWHKVLASQFQRFFTSYAMAANKQWGRKGNLFHRPFQRVSVESENHLRWLIFYIHANPKKHKLQTAYRMYPWSSYQTILSDGTTKLERQTVLYWFGGKLAFEQFHQQAENWMDIQDLIIE